MRWVLCLLTLGCSSAAQSGGSNETHTVSVGHAPDATTPSSTPGCMRIRQTHVYRCSGVPPAEGEPNSTPTTACDQCLDDSHCTAKPGGRCLTVGDGMCGGPEHLACKYPDPACGGQICPEREIPPPP